MIQKTSLQIMFRDAIQKYTSCIGNEKTGVNLAAEECAEIAIEYTISILNSCRTERVVGDTRFNVQEAISNLNSMLK